MALDIYEVFSYGRLLLCKSQVWLSSFVNNMPVKEVHTGKNFSVYTNEMGEMLWNPEGMMNLPAVEPSQENEARMVRIKGGEHHGKITWTRTFEIPEDENKKRKVRMITVPEMSGVQLHELLHKVWQHIAKMKDRSAHPYIWNLAGDVVVNEVVLEVGFPIIPGCVTFDSLLDEHQRKLSRSNLSIEAVYKVLQHEVFLEEKTPHMCAGLHGEEPLIPELPDPEEADEPEEEPKPPEHDRGQPGGGDNEGGTSPVTPEGQEADSPPGPSGSPKPDQEGLEGVIVPLGVPGEEGPGQGAAQPTPEGAAEEVPFDEGGFIMETPLDAKIEDALEELCKMCQGTMPGNLPGTLKPLVEEHMSKKASEIAWYMILRDGLRRALQVKSGRGISRYDKPHRRKHDHPQGLIFPRRIEPQAVLMVAIDTSGSVPTHSLKRVFQEVEHASQLTGGFWLVECDYTIQTKRYIKKGEPIPAIGTGRGGTSFEPPFKLAAEMIPAPNVLVYFTDGEGYAPKVCPPGLNVFWIVDNDNERQEPWFPGGKIGEVIHVKREPRKPQVHW